MNRPHYIYTLSDPRTNRVRYVGCTVMPPEARLFGHICEANIWHAPNREKKDWILALKALGMMPVLDVVETVQGDTHRAREKFWIGFYRKCNAELFNQRHNGYKFEVPPQRGARISYHAAMRRFENGKGPDPGYPPDYCRRYIERKQSGK